MAQRTTSQIEINRASTTQESCPELPHATIANLLHHSRAPFYEDTGVEDAGMKPLSACGFGLPGYVDRRQESIPIALSGSDLLDSFHSNGLRKQVQALFKVTPRAYLSLPGDNFTAARVVAHPSAAVQALAKTALNSGAKNNGAKTAGHSSAAVTPTVESTAVRALTGQPTAIQPVEAAKSSKDSAVARLSGIVRRDRISTTDNRAQKG